MSAETTTTKTRARKEQQQQQQGQQQQKQLESKDGAPQAGTSGSRKKHHAFMSFAFMQY